MRIILLGAPGSGKGTQGDLIHDKYGFPKFSSGDLLRQAVKDGTRLGKDAEEYMKKGVLVPDNLVVDMMRKRILQPDCLEGYVLDGYPRTVYQAWKLEELDPKRGETVIEIFLQDQAVIDRLSARRVCSACGSIFNLNVKPPQKNGHCDACGGELILREDDRPDVIRERLRVYRGQHDALVDFYKNKGTHYRVNGDADIEDVFLNICMILDRKLEQQKEVKSV